MWSRPCCVCYAVSRTNPTHLWERYGVVLTVLLCSELNQPHLPLPLPQCERYGVVLTVLLCSESNQPHLPLPQCERDTELSSQCCYVVSRSLTQRHWVKTLQQLSRSNSRSRSIVTKVPHNTYFYHITSISDQKFFQFLHGQIQTD